MLSILCVSTKRISGTELAVDASTIKRESVSCSGNVSAPVVVGHVRASAA